MLNPTYKENSLKVYIGTVGFGQISAGSHDLHNVDFRTLPGYPGPVQFSAGDVGTAIVLVLGAGASGGNLVTKIATYTSPTEVQLVDAAGTLAVPGTANVIVFRSVTCREGSISHDDSVTDRDQGTFTVRLKNGALPPVAGQPFLICSTDPATGWGTYGAFFGGEIDSVKTPNQPGATGYLESECQCVSYASVLQRRIVRGQQYGNQTVAQIATDVCARGLTAEFMPVTSVTGPTLVIITFDDLQYVADCLDQLVQQATDPTASFWWWTDPYRGVHVSEAGGSTAPFDVNDADGSDSNVQVSLNGEQNRDKFSNQIYMKDGSVLSDPPSTFTWLLPPARGVPFWASVLLPEAPGIMPTVTVGGVPKTIWIVPNYDAATLQAIPAGYDLAWVVGDKSLIALPRDGSSHVLPVGALVVVTYRIKYESIALQAYDDGPSGHGIQARSGIEGGSGLHESLVNLDKPLTMEELRTQAANLARRLGIPPSVVNVTTFYGGLRAGQILNVGLADIHYSGLYLIQSVHRHTEGGLVKYDAVLVQGSTAGDWATALVQGFSGGLPIGVGALPDGTSITRPLVLSFANTPGQVGIAYSAFLKAHNGTPGYTFSILDGFPPDGLSLNASTGEISGIPTQSGSFGFTVEVTDSAAATEVAPATISIAVADTSRAKVTGVTASEVAGSVYQDTNGGFHMVVRVLPIVDSIGFPVPLRYWIDSGDGRGYIIQADRFASGAAPIEEFGGKTQITGVTIPGSLWVPTDPTKIHWSVAVEANSTSQRPSTSAALFNFDVQAAAQVPADSLQNIHFVLNDDGLPIDYIYVDPGGWYWTWRMEATQPGIGSNPGVRNDIYFKSSFFTTQKGWPAASVVGVSGGGVVVTWESGEKFVAGDVGKDIYFGIERREVVGFTDADHVTVDQPTNEGSGIDCITWRPALDREGRDEDPSGIYQGIKFTDGAPASPDGETVVRVGGDTWDVPHSDNVDGSANNYLVYWIRAYGVSRLADNERGGAETVTLQTWPDGNDYGSMSPVPPAAGLDLRSGRANTLGAMLGGGDGVKPLVRVDPTGPLYATVANDMAVRLATDFLIEETSPGSGEYHIAQSLVDLFKAVNYNPDEFTKSAGVMLMKALVVSKLAAGDALFAGTATFAFLGGAIPSTTSQTIGTGSKTFTATSSYAVGRRVRATNGVNWMEGKVTANPGTTITILMDTISGSGTFAVWSLDLSSGKVILNSDGIALQDSITLPTAEVIITAAGITITQVAPTFASGTTYALNDVVLSAGVTYLSLQNANTGHTPASSPTWWVATVATSVQVNASGVGIYGPVGSVALSPAGVVVNQGKVTLYVNGVTSEFNNAFTTSEPDQGSIAGNKITNTDGDGSYLVTTPFGNIHYLGDNTLLGAFAAYSRVISLVVHRWMAFFLFNNTDAKYAKGDGRLGLFDCSDGYQVGGAAVIDNLSNFSGGGLTLSGQVTNYLNKSTAGVGLAAIRALVSLSNQSATYGPTAQQVGGARAPSGLYRFVLYMNTHTAGSGNVVVSVSAMDGVSTKTFSATLVLTSNNSGTATMYLWSDGSGDITATATYTGTGSYDLRLAMEQLA